jgi:hypothetical protein
VISFRRAQLSASSQQFPPPGLSLMRSKEILLVLRDISNALTQLHKQLIVHRYEISHLLDSILLSTYETLLGWLV